MGVILLISIILLPTPSTQYTLSKYLLNWIKLNYSKIEGRKQQGIGIVVDNIKRLRAHLPLPFIHTNFISSGSIICAFLKMSPLSNMLRKEIETRIIQRASMKSGIFYTPLLTHPLLLLLLICIFFFAQSVGCRCRMWAPGALYRILCYLRQKRLSSMYFL